MQQEMEAAQEQLEGRDRRGRSAGGGHGHPSACRATLRGQVDRDRPRIARRPGRRRDPLRHGARGCQRGTCGWRRTSPPKESSAVRRAALDMGNLGGPRPARAVGRVDVVSTSHAPPVQRLVGELSKLPGIGRPDSAAARVFTSCARPTRTRPGAGPTRSREVKERIGPVRGVLQPDRTKRACRICQDSRRDHGMILRRRGAGRP